jgi:hypothetical protein
VRGRWDRRGVRVGKETGFGGVTRLLGSGRKLLGSGRELGRLKLFPVLDISA